MYKGICLHLTQPWVLLGQLVRSSRHHIVTSVGPGKGSESPAFLIVFSSFFRPWVSVKRSPLLVNLVIAWSAISTKCVLMNVLERRLWCSYDPPAGGLHVLFCTVGDWVRKDQLRSQSTRTKGSQLYALPLNTWCTWSPPQVLGLAFCLPHFLSVL